MEPPKHYDAGFYAEQRDASRRSADLMVPLLFDRLKPQSVLDIGCGVGHWLKAFESAGCPVVHGLDGPWVEKGSLAIRPDQFTALDFASAPRPYRPELPNDRYDLVTSFEFVEHVHPEVADALVELMTRLGRVVVVGGAAPLQGGTHHVNEQWPAYWAEKFAARGYVACDFIRPVLWEEEGIMPWYRQNTICYFEGAVPPAIAAFARESWAAWADAPRPMASYEMWQGRSREALPTVENASRMLDRLARNFVKRAIGRE